jgi:hypothetical protein
VEESDAGKKKAGCAVGYQSRNRCETTVETVLAAVLAKSRSNARTHFLVPFFRRTTDYGCGV